MSQQACAISTAVQSLQQFPRDRLAQRLADRFAFVRLVRGRQDRIEDLDGQTLVLVLQRLFVGVRVEESPVAVVKHQLVDL